MRFCPAGPTIPNLTWPRKHGENSAKLGFSTKYNSNRDFKAPERVGVDNEGVRKGRKQSGGRSVLINLSHRVCATSLPYTLNKNLRPLTSFGTTCEGTFLRLVEMEISLETS